MNDVEKMEFKQALKDIERIKIFLEALTGILEGCGNLPDILHKNINGLIYRKNQPWHDDIAILGKFYAKSLEAVNHRFVQHDEEIKNINDKLGLDQ